MRDQDAGEAGYSHRFHAGNVGDVWKHTVLLSVLRALRGSSSPLRLVETHAGEGFYRLGATGEWIEGVAKLSALPPGTPEAVQEYHEQTRAFGVFERDARRYPGSPWLLRRNLRENDSAVMYELMPDAYANLQRNLGDDTRVQLRCGDGIKDLRGLLGTYAKDDTVLVHIDPPYGEKEDWQLIPNALVEAYRSRPQTLFLLWYPVKSYTRPNAMLQLFGKAELPHTTVELISTPLEFQRNRLNGSGMLFVNAPTGVIGESLSATSVLGPLCATHAGRWSSRCVAWLASGK